MKSGPAELKRYREMMQLSPRLCMIQTLEITRSLKELQQFLNQKG
jgi:hypothetical protein